MGLIQHPEKAIRTLVSYDLQYPPLVKASASATLVSNGFRLRRKVNKETMKESYRQLPFSEEAKAKGLLSRAGKVADFLESREVGSEHVLLVLMGYNYGKPIDLESIPVGYTVLLNTENPMGITDAPPTSKERGDDDYDDDCNDDGEEEGGGTSNATSTAKPRFSPYQFCEDLVYSLSTTYYWK